MRFQKNFYVVKEEDYFLFFSVYNKSYTHIHKLGIIVIHRLWTKLSTACGYCG